MSLLDFVCLTGSNWALLGLLVFTGSYWALLGLYWALLVPTVPSLFSLVPIGPLTALYWVLLGLTGSHGKVVVVICVIYRYA